MLDIYIIDYLKKKEKERREEESQRPFLELPIPEYIENNKEPEEEPSRVIVIDLNSDD